MPTKSLTLLKAGRIAEAQSRTEAVEQELDAAKTQLRDAKVSLANAQTDAETAAATDAVKAAEEELSVAKQHADYENASLNRLLAGNRENPWMTLVQYLMFGILASVVLAFLMYGIISETMLPTLSNIATARGLITFLITVITVTIALILVLSTIVSNSPDRAQRFLDGKDLLFALIGVLGTIVGYYFGQSTQVDEGLHVASVHVSNQNPDDEELISLVTFVSGGSAPYTYSITFMPSGVVPDVQEKPSDTGEISAQFKAPKVTSDTDLSFVISVTDSKGKQLLFDSRGAGKTISLKATSS